MIPSFPESSIGLPSSPTPSKTSALSLYLNHVLLYNSEDNVMWPMSTSSTLGMYLRNRSGGSKNSPHHARFHPCLQLLLNGTLNLNVKDVLLRRLVDVELVEEPRVRGPHRDRFISSRCSVRRSRYTLWTQRSLSQKHTKKNASTRRREACSKYCIKTT